MGIWMGGAVPLGYRVENRALHVVEDEAEFVRQLFRRYLEVASVVRLKTALDAENLRSPIRMSGTGRRTGGVPISRGHLYWIQSNPIYIGRLRHKGQIHDGLHPAIIDLEICDRGQQQLESQTRANSTKAMALQASVKRGTAKVRNRRFETTQAIVGCKPHASAVYDRKFSFRHPDRLDSAS